MNQKRTINKILAMLTGVSLMLTSPGLHGIIVKADALTAASESPEVRNINLNQIQDDGSYAIAGINDPGQPANSQTEANVAKKNHWGEETDADGNVTKSGSYVYYGSYQQSSDGDGSYLTEPVKWRVLDADTLDFNASHTMFLMSDQVLDWVNFNENNQDGLQIYSICNLRKWLNSEPFSGSYLEGGFLNNTFCEAEQKAITTSSKTANDEDEIAGDFITIAKDNCGLSQDNVVDKIFVLSAEEANSNIYGFYHQPNFGGSNTKKLTATDYAVSKKICSLTTDYKDWWLRSRVKSSAYSSATVDCIGYLYACNTDGIYSNKTVTRVGVAPAFNMDLSSVRYTSASGTSKVSAFASTSASDSKEWNLTMAGGSGFLAVRNSKESGAVNPGQAVSIDISSIGTPDSGVTYTQISAMLVDSNNTITAYGKIAEPDAVEAEITIPDTIAAGNYTFKIFAEEINSASQQNATDFASNMTDIPITVGDAYTISITNPQDSHITCSNMPGNGTEIQGVLKDGSSCTPIVYTADNGYYFPEDYEVMEVNGITVTRNNAAKITVSGIPTGDTSLTLAAAAKETRPAPVPDIKPDPTPIPPAVTEPDPEPDPEPAPPEVTDPETTTITSAEIKANSKKINMGTNAVYDGKKFTMTWGKVPGSDGYDIFVTQCGTKFSAQTLVKTVEGNKTSATVAKVTGKKNYKLKVQAYKLVNGRKTYWANSYTYHIAGMKNKTYTNAEEIKVSAKTLQLKKGKTSQIKANIVKQSKAKELLSESHGASLRYLSSDTAIATVTAKGKITAKKKGTCYIYVIALNGVSTRIKVTIK